MECPIPRYIDCCLQQCLKNVLYYFRFWTTIENLLCLKRMIKQRQRLLLQGWPVDSRNQTILRFVFLYTLCNHMQKQSSKTNQIGFIIHRPNFMSLERLYMYIYMRVMMSLQKPLNCGNMLPEINSSLMYTAELANDQVHVLL